MRLLDASEKYMFPDEELMKKWFDEFNERFFESKLPTIALSVVYGGKHSWGSFHEPGRKYPKGFHPEECSISLNGGVFKSETGWRNTMVHEMVHYCVYMKYGPGKGHGKEFKAEAKRINACSEFKIRTHGEGRVFRPGPSTIDHWGDHFDDEVILGCYCQTQPEDFEDEDTGRVFKIETAKMGTTVSFRTKTRYIPEIIDNMRNVRGRLTWFRVDAGCQSLFLLPVTTAFPSFRPEDISEWCIVDEDTSMEDFGPVELTRIGVTEFLDDGVQGYNPEGRKEEFRRKYYRDADEIGHLAAERLVLQYREHPRWFTSTIHGTHSLKPSCGEYTIQVDSRFKPLVGMTPKKIVINPVHSGTMMEAVRALNSNALAKEIKRVILSRRN